MLLWLGTYWWTDCSPQLLSSLQTFAPAAKLGAAIKRAQLVWKKICKWYRPYMSYCLHAATVKYQERALRNILALFWTAKCRRSYNFVKISTSHSPTSAADAPTQDQVAHVKPNLRPNVLTLRHVGPQFGPELEPTIYPVPHCFLSESHFQCHLPDLLATQAPASVELALQCPEPVV